MYPQNNNIFFFIYSNYIDRDISDFYLRILTLTTSGLKIYKIKDYNKKNYNKKNPKRHAHDVPGKDQRNIPGSESDINQQQHHHQQHRQQHHQQHQHQQQQLSRRCLRDAQEGGAGAK